VTAAMLPTAWWWWEEMIILKEMVTPDIFRIDMPIRAVEKAHPDFTSLLFTSALNPNHYY
jgi:hypothetical protein